MSIENIQIIETVSLDFYNNNIKTINVKQLDTEARGVKVNCTEHGKKFKLNALSHSAFVRYKKPDGNDVLNDCYIQDDGSVVFALTQQMSAVAGKSKLDILIFCTSGLTVDDIGDISNFNDLGVATLSTMALGLNIHENATDLTKVESSYEYDALIESLARHVVIEKRMSELESTLNTNETQRQNNETARQTAETQRVSAETSRVNAEKLREQNVQNTINNCVKKTDDNITEYTSQMNTIIDNSNQAVANANSAAGKANTSASNANNATTNAQTATSNAEKIAQEMQALMDEINETIGGVIDDDVLAESTTYSSKKIDELLTNPYTIAENVIMTDGSTVETTVGKKLDKTSVVNNLTTTQSGYALDARQGKLIADKIGTTNIASISATITGAINLLNSNINNFLTYGTNSNGSYYKFADGTLICTKIFPFENVSCTTAWGSMYETSYYRLEDWAHYFSSTPVVSANWISTGTALMVEQIVNTTTTYAGNIILCRPTSYTSITGDIHIIGIGRWK